MFYLYKPDPDRFDALYLEDPGDWERFERFSGEPLSSSWRPIEVKINKGEERSDFPFLASHVPVFSRRAWKALEGFLGSTVEALELRGPEDFLAINVLEVIDALDAEQSEIFRFPSGGISSVDRYVLKNDIEIEAPMFKVLQAELKDVLVGESFKQAVAEEGLKGLGVKAVSGT